MTAKQRQVVRQSTYTVDGKFHYALVFVDPQKSTKHYVWINFTSFLLEVRFYELHRNPVQVNLEPCQSIY